MPTRTLAASTLLVLPLLIGLPAPAGATHEKLTFRCFKEATLRAPREGRDWGAAAYWVEEHFYVLDRARKRMHHFDEDRNYHMSFPLRWDEENYYFKDTTYGDLEFGREVKVYHGSRWVTHAHKTYQFFVVGWCREIEDDLSPDGPGSDWAQIRPRPWRRLPPHYPENGAEAFPEGWAEVEFTIAEDGSVRDLRITGSSDARLEDPTLRAAESWRYIPQLRNGEPALRSGVRVRVEFRPRRSADQGVPEKTPE